MEKSTLKRSMFLISYTALLLLLIFRVQEVGAYLTKVMDALSPFLAGFAVAFVLTQPCNFFVKVIEKKCPKLKKSSANGIAVACTYTAVFVVVIALFSVVIPKLSESVSVFVDSLKVYTANLQSWLLALESKTDNALLAELSVDLSSIFDSLSANLERILSDAMSAASFAASQVMAVTGGVVAVLVNAVLALVFSVYMLADRKNLGRQCYRVLYAYVPKKQADGLHFVAKMSAETFSKFVAGQLMEACILGGLCAIGMLFIQADYAMLIGIIIGVSALVPVAGGYIGGGFSFVLLFMVSPMSSLVFVVFLLILQQFEGNVIYPKVVGSSLGLPGLWVVFAVIIGGGIFGILGALLSVPTVSVMYALLRLDVERRESLQK